MAKKYTIMADDKFIGHYHGKTPEEAIVRGMSRYKALFPDFDPDMLYAQKGDGEIFDFPNPDIL